MCQMFSGSTRSSKPVFIQTKLITILNIVFVRDSNRPVHLNKCEPSRRRIIRPQERLVVISQTL
jgi:hypothetical protein